MDYEITITSDHLETVDQVLKFAPNSEISKFTAIYRLEGIAYCYGQQWNFHIGRVYLNQWLKDNLLKRYDLLYAHEDSRYKKTAFVISFEDEADAILFFLTFK